MSATTERAESNFSVADESADGTPMKNSELHLVDPISNDAELGEAAQCRKTDPIDDAARCCPSSAAESLPGQESNF
jgi:hypothetical protein